MCLYESVGSPGTGGADSYELLCGCWEESNTPCSLGALNAELSLSPSEDLHRYIHAMPLHLVSFLSLLLGSPPLPTLSFLVSFLPLNTLCFCFHVTWILLSFPTPDLEWACVILSSGGLYSITEFRAAVWSEIPLTMS